MQFKVKSFFNFALCALHFALEFTKMQAHQLKPEKKSTRKRVGRGGKKGTYSGGGMKGQKSRSGYSKRATFEGGRSTLTAATKKLRGFKSRNKSLQVVNLDAIELKFQKGDEVSPQTLKEKGLISKLSEPVKILSRGEVKKGLTLKDVLVSKSAKDKIEKAGGKV